MNTESVRIVFHFDPPHGRCAGVFRSWCVEARNRGLARIEWDDGGKELVKLSADRWHGGAVTDMEAGTWTVVGVLDSAGVPGYAREEHVTSTVFYRDYNDVDGLLIPICPAEADQNHGPFTVHEAQRREDWPEFQKAIEAELATCTERRTWKLVDKTEALNSGAYIYPTRFVLIVKRSGKYKARLVVRGDHQVFDDCDEAFDDTEDTGTDEETDRAVCMLTHGDWVTSNAAAVDEFMSSEPQELDDDSDSDFEYDNEYVWRSQSDKKDTFRYSILNADVKHKVRNVYRQLFSPVVKSSILMMLVAVAVANGEAIPLCTSWRRRSSTAIRRRDTRITRSSKARSCDSRRRCTVCAKRRGAGGKSCARGWTNTV